MKTHVTTTALRGLLLGSLVLGALSACSSEPDYVQKHPSYVKPGLVMLTPDQAEKHGVILKGAEGPAPENTRGLDATAVLKDPGVKVYSIGRYEDPDDPDLMHEAHLVYRRESSPAWRLQPSAGNRVLVGTRLTERGPNSVPLENKELEATLRELVRENQENRQQIALLQQRLAESQRSKTDVTHSP